MPSTHWFVLLARLGGSDLWSVAGVVKWREFVYFSQGRVHTKQVLSSLDGSSCRPISQPNQSPEKYIWILNHQLQPWFLQHQHVFSKWERVFTRFCTRAIPHQTLTGSSVVLVTQNKMKLKVKRIAPTGRRAVNGWTKGWILLFCFT